MRTTQHGVEIVTTSFEFEYRGYVFDAHATVDRRRFTVLRREADASNIPPCKEILTNDGWQPVIGMANVAFEFSSPDDLICNCQSQIDSLLR